MSEDAETLIWPFVLAAVVAGAWCVDAEFGSAIAVMFGAGSVFMWPYWIVAAIGVVQRRDG